MNLRVIYLCLSALLFAGIAGGVYVSQPVNASAKLPADPNLVARAQRGDIILLDVRSAEEFAEGHIPGAINIPHEEIDTYLESLSDYKNKPVVVYCRSGRRAKIAMDVLKKHNFTDLRHLEGDMMGWHDAGFPVDRM